MHSWAQKVKIATGRASQENTIAGSICIIYIYSRVLEIKIIETLETIISILQHLFGWHSDVGFY